MIIGWKDKKHLIKDRITRSVPVKFYKIIDNLIYSFSHFDLNVEIFYTFVKKRKIKSHYWISLNKVAKSGMPTLMKKIMNIYRSSINC